MITQSLIDSTIKEISEKKEKIFSEPSGKIYEEIASKHGIEKANSINNFLKKRCPKKYLEDIQWMKK